MARQTYYLAKDVRHPLYKTRMLQAGPLELDASAARLYQRLGVELSDEAPRRAAKVEAPAIARVGDHVGIDLSTKDDAPPPAAKKAAPKRRRKK